MKSGLALLALLVALPAAAAEPGELDVQPIAQMMREIWKTQKTDSAKTVQQVWTRTVGFDLPRPFVAGFRAQSIGRFIIEYVPDGETVQAWTRLITVTGTRGAGAARVDDAMLASVLYDARSCPDWRYRDLGATAQPGLPYRTLVIGCGTEGEAGSERGVIAFFRDEEDSWTVQYAARGPASKGLEAGAAAAIARLKPFLTCKTGDKACMDRK
ncbi:hypothetical protein [Glacieibacterium frigidum]|uniref:Uncharacterized protein n=1 Tax=Glacieibacterium frigidum TaxID=2593303 RepID=A0A552UFL2_9SPHN|nr:hypothetical protein [Glacieibacterium frigidum]TRW16994.1 hypothetical protein FMM06_01935 [Glacieibacterium frigidum]